MNVVFSIFLRRAMVEENRLWIDSNDRYPKQKRPSRPKDFEKTLTTDGPMSMEIPPKEDVLGEGDALHISVQQTFWRERFRACFGRCC
jgi:hypothetical protein